MAEDGAEAGVGGEDGAGAEEEEEGVEVEAWDEAAAGVEAAGAEVAEAGVSASNWMVLKVCPVASRNLSNPADFTTRVCAFVNGWKQNSLSGNEAIASSSTTATFFSVSRIKAKGVTEEE